MYTKYLKNNRLYDDGISFEIPKDVRINIEPSGGIVFLRDDEYWGLGVDTWRAPFGEKEFDEFVSDFCENNSGCSVQTGEQTVNHVYMRYAYFAFPNTHNQIVVYFLNVHLIGNITVYSRVWGETFTCDDLAGQPEGIHPVFSAFIDSIRKEPVDVFSGIPACVDERRREKMGG